MNFSENDYLGPGVTLLVGVDEAGRGPLAGPVVAAAVLYDEKLSRLFPEAKDSKKLTPQKREVIFEKIRASELIYGLGIVDSKRIDEVNILNATFEAMKLAVLELESKLGQKCHLVLVDGNKKIRNFERPQITIVKGDALVKTISLASIIAKVTRDKLMQQIHEQWPQYGFDRHKGYGTRLHAEMIARHGQLEIHRKSFVLKRVSESGKI